jgi:proteasome accessory factor B
MKHVTRPQYYRLKRVVEMLREGGTNERWLNSRDFMRELEVSRRTVARDLDFLRDEENAPVAYDAARHGYRLTDESYSLPPMRLTRREVFSFAIARKLLASFEGTPLELDLRSVLRKIADSLEGSITLKLDSVTDRFTVLGDDYVRVNPAIWEAVAAHLEQSRAIQVRYERFDGRVGGYWLEPYHLLAYHGNWYVVARNTAPPGRIETYTLSRMREVQGTGAVFTRPAAFDARSWFRDAFGVTRGEEPMAVCLRFSLKVAAYIKEREWHRSQEMRELPDGRVELRLVTSGRKELVRWILSWMPDVEVVAPATLRERMLEKLRAGIAANDVRPPRT